MIPESASSYAQELKLQVSIVIPVYNQAKTVSASLARIKKVLESAGFSYELVVVNDGSRDETLDVLRMEQARDPQHIRVLSYAPNMGKGYAVKTGIVNTRGELVMFTDGDLDISPHMICEYIKQLEDCDLVIASKRHPLSNYNAPASRKFLSRTFNLVVRILTGIKIKDTQSGMKAGDGSALRAIFKLMLVKRYAFDVELLTIASLLNMHIKEMPVEINLERGFNVRDIVRMFIDLLSISYRLKITKWYQRQLTGVFVQMGNTFS